MTTRPLALSGAELTELVEEVTAHLAAYLDRLPDDLPDRSGVAAVLADPEIRRPPAERGRSIGELLAVLDRADGPSYPTTSPGMLAYIVGGGLASSAVADLVAGVLNRFTGMAAPAPGPVAIEADVLSWLRDLVGLPAGSAAVLTTGASLATLSALVAARHDRLGEQFLDGVLYVTGETHLASARAARVAGLPASAIRLVPTDADFRMDLAALRAAISEDRSAGRRPWCVVGSAGTTSSGVVDPLPALADVAAATGLWFHVDAAYGGGFLLTERGRARLAGIERADSVALDMHKSLFLPFGTGCLLVRDEAALRAAHATEEAVYLGDVSGEGLELPDFAAYTPELTREYRGLRLWLPLHLHGVAAFRAALDDTLDLAELVHEELSRDQNVHVIAAPTLSTVAFRVAGNGPAADAATTELLRRVNAERRVFLSGTSLGGRARVRVCVMGHRTDEARVRLALESISRHAAALVPGSA